MLKNAIDWASRLEPNEPALPAFKGKIAGLMAASPGHLGGVRGLAVLRSILSNIGVVVIPTQMAIFSAPMTRSSRTAASRIEGHQAASKRLAPRSSGCHAAVGSHRLTNVAWAESFGRATTAPLIV